MKFLSFVNAYGTRVVEQRVEGTTTNDREDNLTLGRALRRPQNNPLTAAPIRTWTEEEKDHCDPLTTSSFASLLSDQFHLSSRCIQVVAYTVALLASPDQLATTTADQGLRRVYRYLASLGRFQSPAALLWPHYGTSEVAQSFCRAAAVYGALYVLHTPLSDFNVTFSAVSTSSLNEATDLKEATSTLHHVTGLRSRTTGQLLKSAAIVSNPMLLPQYVRVEDDTTVLCRKICISTRPLPCGEKNTSEEDPSERRCVVIFPPHSANLENDYAIHMLQLDYVVPCVSDGLLHLASQYGRVAFDFQKIYLHHHSDDGLGSCP